MGSNQGLKSYTPNIGLKSKLHRFICIKLFVQQIFFWNGKLDDINLLLIMNRTKCSLNFTFKKSRNEKIIKNNRYKHKKLGS